MAVIYEGKSFMEQAADHAATFLCEEMGGPSRPRPHGAVEQDTFWFDHISMIIE